jgi:fucose permease
VVSYGHVVWSIVAIVVIGVGFGSVFPTIFSVVTTTFKGASGKAGGILTATGSLSASLIPWLQGLILVQYGARTVTYMMAILITLLWAGLLINLRLNKKLASTTL